ncbi:alpha/beta hydrolase [Arthrobacter sp. NPDC058130]|uniref:alpha/beta hydrolase n=1 Tax=Arthrobacter sp. NPDC058130 TaxID=3346353 RepID=UPI0036E2BF39
MDYLNDLRLVDGPVVWFTWFAGAAGLAYLLWHAVLRARFRQGFRQTTFRQTGQRQPVPAAVVLSAVILLAAALTAAVHWFLIYAISVFPDELPGETLAWSVAAVVALLLWLMGLPGLWARGGNRTKRWRPGAAATGAVLAVFLLSAAQINIYFGLNHTVSDLTGTAVARIQPLEAGLTRAAGGPAASGLAHWHAPADLPGGVVRKAVIPGTLSGFQSREAYIYLPPAYQSSPRPALPVLVLFSGQPGSPADWLTGGALRGRLDRFAAQHAGVAPVTVVVDPNGSPSGNTLCMDSRIAQADTFLSRDVPDWINSTLDVDPDPRQWAVGGFSFGGTCAMQMVTRHPDIYSAALAFSSENEPALAKERAKTIEASFGDDTAAFDRQTPLRVMAEQRFDGHGVYFAAGDRDPEFTGYMDVLSGAARRAGFSVESHRVANTGHSWDTASNGLPGGLDFLARRWGISP